MSTPAPCDVTVVANCSICSDDLLRANDTVALPCGHLFHYRCIEQWKETGSFKCPICREEIRVEGITKLWIPLDEETDVLKERDRLANELKESENTISDMEGAMSRKSRENLNLRNCCFAMKSNITELLNRMSELENSVSNLSHHLQEANMQLEGYTDLKMKHQSLNMEMANLLRFQQMLASSNPSPLLQDSSKQAVINYASEINRRYKEEVNKGKKLIEELTSMKNVLRELGVTIEPRVQFEPSSIQEVRQPITGHAEGHNGNAYHPGNVIHNNLMFMNPYNTPGGVDQGNMHPINLTVGQADGHAMYSRETALLSNPTYMLRPNERGTSGATNSNTTNPPMNLHRHHQNEPNRNGEVFLNNFRIRNIRIPYK